MIRKEREKYLTTKSSTITRTAKRHNNSLLYVPRHDTPTIFNKGDPNRHRFVSPNPYATLEELDEDIKMLEILTEGKLPQMKLPDNFLKRGV